jgi:hypothetical protein
VARVFVLLASEGTNDIRAWAFFADAILSNGLLETYRQHPLFNHPPVMGLFAAAILRLFPHDLRTFELLFKCLPFVADLAIAALVGRIAFERGSSRASSIGVAVAYLWSPVAILIAAHHGNTDPLLAAICLLAAWMAEDRRRAFWSGLILGAAINVKLVAVLLVLPLLLHHRKPRPALFFLAGLSLGVLPFLPIFLHAWPEFYRNAIAYNSNLENWGIPFLLLQMAQLGPLHAAASAALAVYRLILGRFLIEAGAIVIGLAGSWVPTLRAVDKAAMTLSLFLVLCPGFGVQYCIWPLPLLFASSLRHAIAYSIAGGVFLFVTYLHFWNGGLPAYSLFTTRYPLGAAIFGLLAWVVLIDFLKDRVQFALAGWGQAKRLGAVQIEA